MELSQALALKHAQRNEVVSEEQSSNIGEEVGFLLEEQNSVSVARKAS